MLRIWHSIIDFILKIFLSIYLKYKKKNTILLSNKTRIVYISAKLIKYHWMRKGML